MVQRKFLPVDPTSQLDHLEKFVEEKATNEGRWVHSYINLVHRKVQSYDRPLQQQKKFFF